MTNTVKTLCPYCGVGCGLEVSPPAQPGKAINRDSQGNPIWLVRGDRTHPSSQGMVCVKGATITESLDKDRLKYPLYRPTLDRPLERITWEQAYEIIVDRMQQVIQNYSADGICMYGSGQLQTEDYYTAQKLLKGCLGTNNFDANSRLCMSSAVSGYLQSFGSDGPPCCYEDLELTDCAVIVGSNMADCHPIAFNRLHKHKKRNSHVKLIVIDPRTTKTAEAADIHLAIKPGTDIDLFNGIAHLLMRWGYLDTIFIDECTQGFPEFAEVISNYTPEIVARKCGIRIDHLEQTARYWGESERVLSLWSMGLNQSSEGTAKVRTLINLHLMSGDIGKPGSGPFSLTGQPNAMGGREAGGLAHLLPGYRMVKNPQHRSEVEQFWNIPQGRISPHPGRDVWKMILGLEQQEVGLLWIVATNPAVSMPDLERTKSALKRSPFTIYQDAYYPTETSSFAHLLLPSSQWSEKTGTMTNSERVVTLCPQFRSPVGESKADWEVFAEVGRRLGFKEQFWFTTSQEIHSEFVQLTKGRPCDMTGMNYDRLRDNPIQWPCPLEEVPSYGGEDQIIIPENKGNFFSNLFKDKEKEPISLKGKRLYQDYRFNTPDGRARFSAFHSKGLAEPPSREYPFVLTVGRLYGHWHTQTRTGRIEKIVKMHPQPFIEIHPRTADKLGIKNGELVEVKSKRGKARFPALITKAITPDTFFVPMHWGALWADFAEANNLTHPESCPSSLQPELKACAVHISVVRS